MLSCYQKILNLLTASTSESLQTLEQQLSELANTDIQTLTCLKLAIKEPSLPQYAKTLATANINSILNDNRNQFTQMFLLHFFSDFLNDLSISIQYKSNLSRSMMLALQKFDENGIKLWKQMAKEMLLNQDMYEIGLLLCNVFSCADINDNLLSQLQGNQFQYVFAIALKKFCGFQHVKKLQYIMESVKNVVQWVCSEEQQSIIMNLSNSAALFQVLNIIYTYFNTATDDYFIHPNLNTMESMQEIQELKQISLNLHTNLLESSIKISNNTLLYQCTGLQVQKIVRYLCIVALNSQLLKESTDEVAILMLKLLRIMVNDAPHLLKFSWKQIIHYILFPFLSISKTQLSDFQQNTGNFVQISDDCCEKQKLGLLKTQAAHFLELMVDLSNLIQKQNQQILSIDKILNKNQTLINTYVLSFAIASIKSQLQMQAISSNQFFQIYQIPANVKCLTLQCAFMILSIFSYSLIHYPKQLQNIKIIICSQRLKQLPPLQRARIYTFLSYNFDQIFTSSTVSADKTLKHWVDQAFTQKNHLSVEYCALDFISTALQRFYDENTLKMLVQKVTTNRANNYWSLLKKMAQLFALKFSEDFLIFLVNEIYARMQKEFEYMRNQQIKMTFIVSNLLQVLRIIAQKGQLLGYKPKFKQLLWKTATLYPISVENAFEDDVIKVINSFLVFATQEQLEMNQVHYLLPLFIKQFQKSEFQYTYYFIALNHFIMNGNFETSVKPIYQVMKKSLQYWLIKRKSEANRKKIPIAHTLLLLQNIVALYGLEIGQEQTNYISKVCEELYPIIKFRQIDDKVVQKLVFWDRNIFARAISLQFLIHLYFPQQNLIQNLRKYHDLKLFYSYDTSVIISCLKIQIMKQKNLQKLIILLQMCIKIIYQYTKMDSEMKEHALKKTQKKLLQKMQMEQYVETSQNNNNKNHKKKQDLIIRLKRVDDYQVILIYINTPFTKSNKQQLGRFKNIKQVSDIREQFIKLLKSMRQSNSALYESIISGYSDYIKIKLVQITESTGIQTILSGQFTKVSEILQKRRIFTSLRPKMGIIQEEYVQKQVFDSSVKRRNYEKKDQQLQQDEDLRSDRTIRKRKQKQQK